MPSAASINRSIASSTAPFFLVKYSFIESSCSFRSVRIVEEYYTGENMIRQASPDSREGAACAPCGLLQGASIILAIVFSIRHNGRMLLVFPPVAKPAEPPAGIATLAAALKAHNISCTLLDMNLEALLWLLEQPASASDGWTARAVKNRTRNIAALRDSRTYCSPGRYGRAVHELARLAEAVGKDRGAIAGLADYHDGRLSPVRSADLMAAAEHPERNVY